MFKLKKVITFALVIAMVATMSVSAFAAAKVENSHAGGSEIVTGTVKSSVYMESKYPDISFESIKIDNTGVKLYPEFVERDKAFDYLITNYSDVILFLQKKFNLDEISMENWQEYYYALREAGNEVPGEKEIEMLQFFDIFENQERNDEVRELYNQVKLTKTSKADILDELNLFLPYDPRKHSVTPKASIGLDVEAAIRYAEKHATSPNKRDYAYFPGKDCTNFTSQILEAGGIDQEDYYPDETRGWWHRVYYCWFTGDTHYHSISWIRADTFARYMGVGYKTKVHEDFSENLKKGDLIAYDASSDGDWDHIGFVTDIGDTVIRDGKIYTDYKVAQHSRNYHAWVSDDINGWETLEDNGYTYGRVRR